MSEPEELILGNAPVSANLVIGSERLRLFFTKTRIIIAHIGKRGVASPSLGAFFGRLSGALEDLFKSRKESVTKHALSTASPAEILAADKDNFSIDYSDVVTVEVDIFGTVSSLTLVTRDDKFRFTTTATPELLRLLRMNLGEKVKVS